MILLRHWRSAIEITIIACALYYSWKFFRKTRGAKVLVGLATLLLSLTLLSAVLQLTVIAMLLRSFSTFFILALIVIFQPELRRILAELGSRPLITGAYHQTEVIEAVVSAIEFLQAEKFGALIAFEREIIYQPGYETGTEIDAKVNEDLLITIFYPKTPLHDGGTVIRRDRITAAAAIFPLSQVEGLERNLGLRHRAALGLSDETDALVVVLSEETGTISIAYDGELERPLTIDKLRERLTEILTNQSGNETTTTL